MVIEFQDRFGAHFEVLDELFPSALSRGLDSITTKRYDPLEFSEFQLLKLFPVTSIFCVIIWKI